MNNLTLTRTYLTPEYRKKWNVSPRTDDFYTLNYKGHESHSIYRKGGFFNENDLNKDYFMLLKQVEDYYSDHILKMSATKDPKHLDQRWAIIDKFGNEKKVFESFKCPYLSGGVIYSVDSEYFNIETGESYGYHQKTLKSKNYIFLDQEYHKDVEKRGVWKVELKTGKYEIIK